MPLTHLDDNLWVARRPLPLWVGDLGARMTVIRLDDGGLLLHSPVECDPETAAAVEALGDVRWLLGPSLPHHLFLGGWAERFPDAKLCGVPGLPDKRPDLCFDRVLESGPPEWGSLQAHLFAGAPLLSELVLFHPGSRTLVVTDLAFNVRRDGRNEARLFHWLVGAVDQFGPHRLVRATAFRDRAACRRSVEAVLAWDFDRVVVSHGEVLETGGHQAFCHAFEFLG
jgi:hypothetical protein